MASCKHHRAHFNSHAPCGARLGAAQTSRTGSGFQLTRPLRGATLLQMTSLMASCISTHTPLAGRDGVETAIPNYALHFNSHAPCGARRLFSVAPDLKLSFQLTRPLRGATAGKLMAMPFLTFQLTRPLRGATRRRTCRRLRKKISTHTPLAGRNARKWELTRNPQISTHTPLAGRDRRKSSCAPILKISTHTPLAGRDYMIGSPLQ